MTQRFSDSVKEASKATSTHGNPVKQFIDLCLRPDEEGFLKQEDLHGYYKLFADEFGYKPMSWNILASRMKEAIPDSYSARRKLKASEPGFDKDKQKYSPAHWRLAPLPGIFSVNEFNKLIFNKCRVEEGGIDEFGSNGSIGQTSQLNRN